MSELRAYAWAAFCADAKPRPFIHEGIIRRTASECRMEVGLHWRREGEGPSKGWQRARRNGWRVIRVSVEPAFGYAEGKRDD